MRRAIVAALFVAAVAAALPWALGRYLQHRHGLVLDELGERGYRIVADEYHPGWLRSNLRTEIAPAVPADGNEPSRLRLDLRLRHGPAVWIAAWPPVLATAAGRASLLGGPRALPPLVLVARLHATGALDVNMRVPDVAYSGAAGRLVLVAGDAQLGFARDEAWALDGHLESLEATAPDGRRLRLEAIDWALAGADADGALPVSRLRLGLGALHLDATAAQPGVDIEGFETTLTVDHAAAVIGLALTGTLNALLIDQDAYAPSGLTVAVRGIDAVALGDLRNRLAALDRSALSASQQGMITGRLLLAALPKLLSGTPAAELRRLSVTTPHGAVDASAQPRVAPADSPPRPGAAVMAAPPDAGALLPALFARLDGSGRIAVPQSLVVALLAEQQTRRVRRELALRGEPTGQLPRALAADVDAAAQAAAGGLVREGWLKSEQGRLVAELRLADGNLSLNGKSVALQGWLAGPERP